MLVEFADGDVHDETNRVAFYGAHWHTVSISDEGTLGLSDGTHSYRRAEYGRTFAIPYCGSNYKCIFEVRPVLEK